MQVISREGVVSLVVLSVLEVPLSEPATRSGAPGADSAVSMVTLRPEEAAETLPARSVAVAVKELVPSAMVLAVRL